MPTPSEILLDPVSLAVLSLYGGLILLEAVFPARPLPRIPGWHARALASEPSTSARSTSPASRCSAA